MTVLSADSQLTLSDIEQKLGWTQFTTYFFKEHIAQPMTEENCHNENWVANSAIDRPDSKADGIISLILSFIKWFIAIIEFLLTKLTAAA